MKYDIIVVGAGFYGATFANLAHKSGKKVLVIDKRNHIGGNCYTEIKNDIVIHKYGAHIFHTSNQLVWNYINSFGKFIQYEHHVKANYNGKLYDLPFNMNTFYQLWNTTDKNKILKKIKSNNKIPKNLEEQAINIVGKDIYKKLIKGYTEKQWCTNCKNLPTDIIKRIPLRFTFDNNYFNDCYQGIPLNGYTEIIMNMLKGIDIELNTRFDKNIHKAKLIVYTGSIDEYFDYCYGVLDYRSLMFCHEHFNMDNYQGSSVVNYTDKKVPYTRIIEHKHFNRYATSKDTFITKEYPQDFRIGLTEPYYPINTKTNNDLYKAYTGLVKTNDGILFGGRLGNYKYYDMDKVINKAMEDYCELFGKDISTIL